MIKRNRTLMPSLRLFVKVVLANDDNDGNRLSTQVVMNAISACFITPFSCLVDSLEVPSNIHI